MATKLTTETAAKLRKAGLEVDSFSDPLKDQMAKLSAEEIQSLASIKNKLNTGLAAKLKNAADTVGGFVW